MDQTLLKRYEDKCTQDSPPTCQARCPFRLDVRRLIANMREGKWQQARNLLEKTLPFAHLLCTICDHPCETACVQNATGEPIAINDLERTCLLLAKEVPPSKTLPQKPLRIAVVGSGIAGCAAAWELSLKGYQVTILYASSAPGAFLASYFAASATDSTQDFERAEGIADTITRLGNQHVLFLQSSINTEDIRTIQSDYDGVFVDLREFPHLLPPTANVSDIDPLTGSFDAKYTLCFGGYSESVITQAFEGKRGAVTLTRVLSNASPTALRELDGPCISRLHVDCTGLSTAPRVPSQAGVFSEDTAQQEATRCMQCECMQCVNQCEYLRHYDEYPKVYARQMFLNMGIFTGYRRANRQINSCTLCRQCEVVCPEAFSMADLCLDMRKEMVRQGKMPPSAHSFALEELRSSTAPDATLFLGHTDNEPCAHVFFPGCQLAASRPNQVRLLFRHLRQTLSNNTGIWLRCCGVPAHYAARADLIEQQQHALRSQWHALGSPRVILACASCFTFFQEYIPEIPIVSLWEVLDQEAKLPTATVTNEIRHVSLHDPCTARHNSAWRAAVRNILNTLSLPYVEPAASGTTTACCGYGGLVWNAHPEMADNMTKSRAQELTHTALTSCIMCRDRFISIGKPAWHLFDLLLPSEATAKVWMSNHAHDTPVSQALSTLELPDDTTVRSGQNAGPGFSQRRINRIQLKEDFRVEEFNCPSTLQQPAPWELYISPEVLNRIEQKYILQQDIREAISEAEASKTVLFDKNNNQFIARYRKNPITFWVIYTKETTSRVVLDAYMHRMDVIVEPQNKTP